jgi:hypothetical protein
MSRVASAYATDNTRTSELAQHVASGEAGESLLVGVQALLVLLPLLLARAASRLDVAGRVEEHRPASRNAQLVQGHVLLLFVDQHHVRAIHGRLHVILVQRLARNARAEHGQ